MEKDKYYPCSSHTISPFIHHIKELIHVDFSEFFSNGKIFLEEEILQVLVYLEIFKAESILQIQ